MAYAQTAIQTSFETADSYSVGNLNGQNGWSVSSGASTVYTTKARTGTQSLNFAPAGTALLVNKISYSGTVPGITGDVYADMWVNPSSITTNSFAINGYDLYGGSSKRIFVIEFMTSGTIRAYNGSTAVNIGTWTANTWTRISIKMDCAAGTYQVAVNATVNATTFAFRESYTPTASGTRVANTKEYHSLRINNLTDTNLATSDVAVDDLYIGTTAISDVSFGGSSTVRTITVTQPAYGSIALSPAAPYNLNQSVTATLTLPMGYQNNGWTGDLSGTALVQNFTVTGNMTIGANVDIDPNNPPPKYLITVNQPANGTITLSPTSADGMYYKEALVTATVTFDACYAFSGWTGDLSGSTTPKTFTVQSAMTIGATIGVISTPPVLRQCSTVTQIKNAIAAMNPGDMIEVADGTYNLSGVSITRSGCASNPIVIYAKNKGGVTFNGSTALTFKNVNYITLTGFNFQSTSISTGIKLENCRKIKITGNNFAYTETTNSTWIYIGDTYGSTDPLISGYNSIDHNTFTGKTWPGNYIKLDGTATQQTQYDTISYNWFKDNKPRAANEKESIRIGFSGISRSSGFTLVERNLFEECDGDPEVVSIKTCDNTIRYNTFLRCLGTLSFRHGDRSVAEGNYFLGEGRTGLDDSGSPTGCGGVRIYGKGHKIINNYFSGLTGSKWDAAITITNGDVNSSSTSLNSHYLPEDLVVAFNTLVNNVSNIEIGFTNNGNYNKAPINCLIANNIIVDNLNPIVKSFSSTSLAGVAFSNNIMYPTGTSSIGITTSASQVTVANPLLVQPNCTTPSVNCTLTNAYKVFRISAGSPAIDAATGSYPYITLDNEKQTRSGALDIGADEYLGNASVTIGAIDATHVGPNAVDFEYSYAFSPVVPVTLVDFKVNYTDKKAQIRWQVAEEINVKHYEVEWKANSKPFTTIATVAATAKSNTKYYEAQHEDVQSGINYYRLKMVDNDGTYRYSTIKSIMIDDKNTITVYPNPAKGSINLDISGIKENGANVEIINVLGMVMKQYNGITLGQNSLDIQGLPAGMYQLKINEQGQVIKRVAINIAQ